MIVTPAIVVKVAGAVRVHRPTARIVMVASCEDFPAFPGDLVAVVAYTLGPGSRVRRWALVQRFAGTWVTTLGLSVREATEFALAVAGKEDNHARAHVQSLRPGGADATA